MKIPNDEEFIQRFEAESRAMRERVRRVIGEAARSDVLTQYDIDMRDLDLGLTTARSCWHSISAAQARTLTVVGTGREAKFVITERGSFVLRFGYHLGSWYRPS